MDRDGGVGELEGGRRGRGEVVLAIELFDEFEGGECLRRDGGDGGGEAAEEEELQDARRRGGGEGEGEEEGVGEPVGGGLGEYEFEDGGWSALRH